MDCLPRDIVCIIYRLIHSDVYSTVNREFDHLYVSKWNDQESCYADNRHDLIASWRRCIYGTYINIWNGKFIYDMLTFPKKYVPSKRGGFQGILPKNY